MARHNVFGQFHVIVDDDDVIYHILVDFRLVSRANLRGSNLFHHTFGLQGRKKLMSLWQVFYLCIWGLT